MKSKGVQRTVWEGVWSERGREPRRAAGGGVHAGLPWYHGSQQHHPSANRALKQ